MTMNNKDKTEEMETLLTKLIEKWRKPFGLWWCPNRLTNYDGKHNRMWFEAVYCIWEDEYDYGYRACSLRQLVSIESWLWQFCIANHLLKKYSDLWDDWEYIIGRWQDWKDCKTEDWEYIDDNRDSDIYHQDDSYQYRLIESALRDEDKLEDFILSNIKVEWIS